jgi:hypothetical protein
MMMMSGVSLIQSMSSQPVWEMTSRSRFSAIFISGQIMIGTVIDRRITMRDVHLELFR